MNSLSQDMDNIYKDYYEKKGSSRNNPLNPEVFFQRFAGEMSFFQAMSSFPTNPQIAKVLDVGCGTGESLLNFLSLGFPLENLHGIDILPERIQIAQKRLPKCHIELGDASKTIYDSDFFDIVYESTIFLQMLDDSVAKSIATEMTRVCKSGGHLVLTDWRYSHPWDNSYKGVSRKRLKTLFSDPSLKLERSFSGALVPPIGRFFSKHLSSLYFLIHKLFPFLVGQVTYVLKKS
ncbi:MAG: class I SAM-dependent methyltransferase [Candidatus Riflebacteria bacterium]|nr:class I SAM-dependent methyltransferase [Candidatus Riflebacteria bacterium]